VLEVEERKNGIKKVIGILVWRTKDKERKWNNINNEYKKLITLMDLEPFGFVVEWRSCALEHDVQNLMI
jgi:hypothetical protein